MGCPHPNIFSFRTILAIESRCRLKRLARSTMAIPRSCKARMRSSRVMWQGLVPIPPHTGVLSIANPTAQIGVTLALHHYTELDAVHSRMAAFKLHAASHRSLVCVG